MVQEYLKFAIIELMSVCNLRCIHCYNLGMQDGLLPIEKRTYKKAFRLIDHLIRKTTVNRLTFTGGEPCICERLPELVLHARLNERRVTVITNGNGLPDVYSQLAKMRVDMMQFSIHSSKPEIHDQITRVPGSHKKAIENMTFMIENGIKVTPVVVITSLNCHDTIETIRFLNKMGLNSIMVNRYNIGGEGLKHKHLSANTEQLRETFRQLNNYAETHYIRLFSGVCTPFCLLDPKDYPRILFGACSADPYKRPLTFDLDGNLRFCNHSPINAGNIYNQSLAEIFSNPYFSEWEDLDIEFCTDCNRLKSCKGGCRAASEQMGYSLKTEDPIIKELNVSPYINTKPS
jgi:radical SAM protein with 4Fe4S-binding SPASM domain